MKKIIYMFAVLMAIATTSCTQKKADSESADTETRNIVFESYTYDLIGEYPSSDSVEAPGGKYVRFVGQGILPQDIGDTNILHLRDTLIRISQISFNGADKPVPVMPDSMIVTNLNPIETEACGEALSTLTTTLMNPRVVVWENTKESYACGAAHGNTSESFINFSMADGKILEYKDIFKEGYTKPLTDLIRNKLKEGSYELLVPVKKVEQPKEFAITSKGILFSYDPYQIAPYSEGFIQVELSTAELSDLLSPEGNYILTGVKVK